MNAFESIIAHLLQRDHFWTRIGYKVELTPEAKRAIGTPSMPRLEIDVLAYYGETNLFWWVECKS